MTTWLLAGLLALLAGCTPDHITFLDPQGPIAAAQCWHLVKIVALMMAPVLPVLILTPVIAWRYRRRNERSRYTPKWVFFWPLEVAIWGVPICIVAILGVLLWHSTQALDPYAPLRADKPPLHVQVVGLDWKWLFIYPDQRIASVGELAFPADRPIALELTTDTVMQSFFIPALGGQIYAMPSGVTKLHLKASGPGRFQGENAQYNGKGFHEQKFTAIAMTADEFDAWVNTLKARGIALDEASYAKLARRSTIETAQEALGAGSMPKGVLYFSEASPDLFAKIVDKYRYGQAKQAPGPVNAGEARAEPSMTSLAADHLTRPEAGK